MSAEDSALIECVPNVSEGRNPRVLAALRAAIETASDVHLLHEDVGVDAHRTVYTFAGAPEAVGDAAIRLGHAVARHIDMRHHQGAHARLGALDVCPFVPIRGVTLARCAGVARRVASVLAHDLRLPVYLYEAAAYADDRRSLADLRRGEYESLGARFSDPEHALARPDYGPAACHARLGAAVVGARPFLIAWNVSLATEDVSVARRIAGRVRTSGTRRQGPGGRQTIVPGRLHAVRAIGWVMPSYGCAQVSMNILDYRQTPLHVAYDAVAEEAALAGTGVVGSELVGLVPAEALLATGRATLGDETVADDEAVQAAITRLGLDHLAPFDPSQRIVERVLERCAMAEGGAAASPRPR